MLDEQIHAYLQAVRRREAARKKFAEMTEVITEVAKRMAEEQKSAAPRNPRVVHHHGFGMNGGFVEPHRWPTADAITKARQELAAALAQVEESWNQIPHEQRLGLASPTAAS